MAKYCVTFQLIGTITVEADNALDALEFANSKEDDIMIESMEMLSIWNEDTDKEESPW